MNWEAISAISELVGVTAVMITFIYLAVQIRQNTIAVATSTYESVMTGFNDINIVVAGDPAQFMNQPGCKPFRAQNALFADLYTELDKHGSGEISDFGFANKTPVESTPKTSHSNGNSP